MGVLDLLKHHPVKKRIPNVEVFLKIDGLEGESHDTRHRNEIDVLDFEFAARQSQPSSSGTGPAKTKVTFEDIGIAAGVDKSAPKLFLACANGERFKTAALSFRLAGGKDQPEFFKCVLSDVLVSYFHIDDGGAPASVPLVYFSLSYGKVEIEYKEPQPDGSLGGPLKAGWSLKENKQV